MRSALKVILCVVSETLLRNGPLHGVCSEVNIRCSSALFTLQHRKPQGLPVKGSSASNRVYYAFMLVWLMHGPSFQSIVAHLSDRTTFCCGPGLYAVCIS